MYETDMGNGRCPKCAEEGHFSFLIAQFRKTSTVAIDSSSESSKEVSIQLHPYAQKERFSRLVMEARECFEGEEYLLAKRKYEEALSIFNHRDDLHDRIQECEAKMKPEDLVPEVLPTPDGALGLCVLLMDASGSMFEPNAFPDSPENRAQVVAKAAAKGIMSLRGRTKSENAYLAIYKFDHRVRPVFIKSIAEIGEEFGTEKRLEEFLYSEMEGMGGESDLNAALQSAYELVSEFLNKEVSIFRNARAGKGYPIIMRPVTNQNTMDQVEVPNVRVFIYTDGIQYVEEREDEIVNPFLDGGGLPNCPVDILLGAYIGTSSNEDCEKFKAILSDCPEHDERQFFLVETPDDALELAGIFRMASGNSGFCPACVKKEGNQITNKELEIKASSFKDLL